VIEAPLDTWLQSTTFLSELNSVKKAYNDGFKLLPLDLQQAIRDWYLCDLCHSIDLFLCMLPYRDLQYGPKGGKELVKLRRRVKLGWIAYNIHVAQKLLNDWSNLERELWEWYNSEGRQCRVHKSYIDEESFRKNFVNFLNNYLNALISELSVLYVYLYNDKPVMPLGFMQHLVTMGPSGSTLGDLIDIETLTFIDVKSYRSRISEKAEEVKSELLSLMINTRLPVAIAVPRYRVDENTGEPVEDGIVVELYVLRMEKRDIRNIYINKEKELEAEIEDELKPLLQGITLLRNNAENYLNEKKRSGAT
jgi:hypothetical protein